MAERLRLVSDFRDYYDHWFDSAASYPDAPAFERMSTGGMDRREMFAYLRSLGLVVPEHGTVRDLAQHGYPLVVYDDIRAHRGEGKRVMLPWDAERECPDAFCARFYGGLTVCEIARYYPDIHSHAEQRCRASTIRLLAVGERTWRIGYWSTDDWRSNWGEGGVAVLEETTTWGPHRRAREIVAQPLWAIDFVYTEGGMEIAVDFNVAPGLRGSGIEDVLPAQDVVALLKAAHPTRPQ